MRTVTIRETHSGGTSINIGGVEVVYPRGLSTWQAYRGQSLEGLLPIDPAWGKIGPRLYKRYLTAMADAIRNNQGPTV